MVTKVVAIIVNYHSQNLICRCLRSLKQHLAQMPTVVVVDNSDYPDSWRVEEEFPDTIILRSDGNVGFAGGCNIGIRVALERGAEYILLLNPDTRAVDDFILPLTEVLDRNPVYGLVGPTIYREGTEKEIWFSGSWIRWWLGGPRHLRSQAAVRRSGFRQVPFLPGCAMLLRAKAVREVGLMDERYFLYFEDADYALRFHYHGWKAGYVPDACILHSESSTTDFASEKYVYFFSRNRILFARLWAKRWQFLVFFIGHTLVRLPTALLVFTAKYRRPELVRAFLSGYVDGLKASNYSTIVPSRKSFRF